MVSGRCRPHNANELSSSATDIRFTLSLLSDSVLENAGPITAIITPVEAPPNDVVLSVSTSPFTATGMSYFEKGDSLIYYMCVFLLQIQMTTLGCLRLLLSLLARLIHNLFQSQLLMIF